MTADVTKRICVVGGGAAGMMAACTAEEAGAAVTVIEPNSMVGRKLRITGKGRCNVTNNCTPEEFLVSVVTNRRFLYGAIYRFTPQDTMSFFEGLGVPLKTERGRRVFPVSDKAADIAGALERCMRKRGVTIVHGKADGIDAEADGNGDTVRIVRGVRCGDTYYPADAVIIATGGVSYPGTGSTGDGHRMAEREGIEVTPLEGSLVPIVTSEDTSPMMGLTLKNVTLTVTERKNGAKVFSEIGELLFTHFGISGPLALSASAHMKSRPCDFEMFIDLKPALDDAVLDNRLIGDLSKYSRREFRNSLGDLLPKKLIDYAVASSRIDPYKHSCEVTREERHRLLDFLKRMPLTPSKLRPVNEAIVTRGGVNVRELDPKTMMSKKVQGLYFAGEIIDVDAYTGGYNLQIAFSTGVLAGKSAAEYVGV